MAAKTRSPGEQTEEERVADHRRQAFKKLLPEVDELKIEQLVVRDEISPHADLKEKLLNKGCDPEVAVEILR